LGQGALASTLFVIINKNNSVALPPAIMTQPTKKAKTQANISNLDDDRSGPETDDSSLASDDDHDELDDDEESISSSDTTAVAPEPAAKSPDP
jgi:hypothetical protein